MSQKVETMVTVHDILIDLDQVAQKLGIRPQDVTRAQYYANGGKYKEWQIRSKGGLTKIQAASYPKDPIDLSVVATQNASISYARKMEKALGTFESREARLRETIRKSFAAIPMVRSNQLDRPKKIKRPEKMDRYNIGHLSDIHFGITIDPLEVEGNQYNWTVAARRLASVVDSIAHYKLDHRKECGGLVLNMGGDLAQGIIHADDHNVDLMVWQFTGTVRYLVQAIDHLLGFYDHIKVPVTPDNHMRLLTHTKGKDRAKAQKYDSFNTMVFEAVQQAFRNDTRVEFIVPRTPYTTFKVFDRTMLSTHGDTWLSLGNPGGNLSTSSIANQINHHNAGLPDAERVQAIFAGHVHTAVYVGLENDVDLFINPPLSGADPFAQSLMYKPRVGQWMVESTRDYRIGDKRVVWVSDADENDGYDSIIKPFDYELMLDQTGR